MKTLTQNTIFFNTNCFDVNFSITIACTQSEFGLLILWTHVERTVSQILYLGLSSHVITKIRKHLKKK